MARELIHGSLATLVLGLLLFVSLVHHRTSRLHLAGLGGRFGLLHLHHFAFRHGLFRCHITCVCCEAYAPWFRVWWFLT